MSRNYCLNLLLQLALVVSLPGCISPTEKASHIHSSSSATNVTSDESGGVRGLGIESQDFVSVCDKMSRGLSTLTNGSGSLRIFTARILNETHFEINSDILLTRIRATLIRQSNGRFEFIARDWLDDLVKERQMKREGKFTSETSPHVQEFKGGDYLLTGRLQGHTTRMVNGLTSEYVIYSFQLINARTDVIEWEDFSEIKKVAKLPTNVDQANASAPFEPVIKPAAAPPKPDPVASARVAAEAWLLSANSGNLNVSRDTASRYARGKIGSAPAWYNIFLRIRKQTGGFRSRDLIDATVADQYQNGPFAEYCIMNFSSIYERGVFSENVVMIREADGIWRLFGYNIR